MGRDGVFFGVVVPMGMGDQNRRLNLLFSSGAQDDFPTVQIHSNLRKIPINDVFFIGVIIALTASKCEKLL